MSFNRRDFLKTTGLGLSLMIIPLTSHNLFADGQKKPAGIGMCDWNLGKAADPELIPRAKEAHLQGIQVSVGTDPDNIPLRIPAIRKKYIELGKQYGIVFHSVAAGGILNSIPLASEPQSAVYVIDAIEAAKALGAKNILIAFFGNGDLRLKDSQGNFIKHTDGNFATYELDTKAVKRVIETLRQIAPRAEDAGVALGLENTLSAKQNIEIIEQIGSKMAQVYYDLGNSTGYGYDVYNEIRLLGNDRICEIHLKDWKTKMLGDKEGEVEFQKHAQVLAEIGYDKWLVLETSGRENNFIEDTRANIAFAKQVFNF